MAREPVEMLIESVTMEVPDTKTIRLTWPAGYNPEFQTGQFITVYWPDAPGYKRAYSLSSSALDRGAFEVTIKRDGKMGTRIVDWAKPGDKLFVLPPAGKFLPVFESDKHLICIAGGSGVTPFRGFAREATQRGLETRLTVLYSVRTTNDIIFKQEFHELTLPTSISTSPAPACTWAIIGRAVGGASIPPGSGNMSTICRTPSSTPAAPARWWKRPRNSCSTD
jgi:ferredoxin-NADP reductase